MTNMELGKIFLENYPIDKNGFSQVALIDDLTKINPDFKTKNGCQWARTNSSWLGKQFNIKRELRAGRTYSVQLVGFNQEKIDRTIPRELYNKIDKKCSVLDIGSTIEIDHKDGRYTAAKEDFNNYQALCKTVNDAKRQHCKECRNSGIRFDARRLGSCVSYVCGNANSNTCKGCYWHDPKYFWKIATGGEEN